MIDFRKLKEIAREKIKQKISTLGDFAVFLEIWWSEYYKLPSNHHLFLERTMEEHILDYYIKSFQENPESLNHQTIDDIESDEKWMKDQLGEEFRDEYDSLLGSDMTTEDFNNILEKIEEEKIKSNLGLKKEDNVEFEEDFTDINVEEGSDGEK